MDKADELPALSLKLPDLPRFSRMPSTTFDEVVNWLFMGEWSQIKTPPIVDFFGKYVQTDNVSDFLPFIVSTLPPLVFLGHQAKSSVMRSQFLDLSPRPTCSVSPHISMS